MRLVAPARSRVRQLLAQKGEVIDICAVGCEQEVPDSVEQPQGEKLGALIWREECLAR
jgi:hypothetical protein